MKSPHRAPIPAFVLLALLGAACGGTEAPPETTSTGAGGVGGGTGAGGSGGSTSTATSSTSSTSTSTSTTTSTTSSTTTTTSGAGGGCMATVPAATDLFDGSSLDPSWTVLHPNLVNLAVASGKLRMTPNQYLLWYNQNQGTLVSKPVTGDFKATTTVRARRASNPSLPPDQNIHLAGLMARRPGGSPESYVFIVVGNDVNDLSVETKTTTNGMSDYIGPSWGSGDADLRICRLGAAFHLYKRAIGASSWTLAITYDRPDLPATLEVGPNVYAASGTPDLQATWDEVRFEGVCDPAGCAAD